MPTQVGHRSPVSTQASLASAIFSFGARHELKGNPTLSTSIPTEGEDPAPDRTATGTKHRGSPASHPTGYGYSSTNHIP